MRFVLIDAGGDLHVTGGGADAWLEDVGDTNPTRVPLAPLDGGLGPITGWVNSAGSPTHSVNPLGGQTLVNLGAPAGDYYGPVLVTGWDPVVERAIGIHSDQSVQIVAAYDAAEAQQG
ncbi:hypothetical protein [Nonomuraea sp. NPDC023979]|uniref:hypothetical protein n=1 Tax=Nonomuraea sp. NPDC023979 TaxID=3154796 RepID=UPI00340E3CDA